VHLILGAGVDERKQMGVSEQSMKKLKHIHCTVSPYMFFRGLFIASIPKLISCKHVNTLVLTLW